MLNALHDIHSNGSIRIHLIRIELSEPQSGVHQRSYISSKLGLGDQVLAERIELSIEDGAAEFKVAAGTDARSCSLRVCLEILVLRDDVGHGTSVTDYVTLETPFVAGDVREKQVIGTRWNTIHTARK